MQSLPRRVHNPSIFCGALAAIAISAAILSLLIGTFYYIAEILVALSSVREEAEFFLLPDISASGGVKPRPEEPEEGWQEQKG